MVYDTQWWWNYNEIIPRHPFRLHFRHQHHQPLALLRSQQAGAPFRHSFTSGTSRKAWLCIGTLPVFFIAWCCVWKVLSFLEVSGWITVKSQSSLAWRFGVFGLSEFFLFQYLLKNKSIISEYFSKESTLHSGVLFVRLVKDMSSGIVDCSCICIAWNGGQEWVWLQLASLFHVILVWYIHVLGSFQIKTPA